MKIGCRLEGRVVLQNFKRLSGVLIMGILRRSAVLLIVAGLVAVATEAHAKSVKVKIFATLSSVAGAPVSAKGKAKYDASSSRKKFSVEAENLRRLNGQMASIFVDGRLLGTRPIALGVLKLEVSSERGGSVPVVGKDTKVDVMVGSVKILSGSF
jgi:hypothetical protein